MTESDATVRHFDRAEVWGPDSAYGNPVQRARADTIRRAFPPGTRTLLDVGCGDGTVTNRLAADLDVVGVDTSPVALEHVDVPTRVASAGDLPFADRSFDGVLLSEVLEHLDERTYSLARREAARVAARTIVVTVPNREILRDSAVRCPRCRTLFSPWHHQRSFGPRRLRGLFPGFVLDLVDEIGPDKPRPSRVEAWARSVVARPDRLWFPAICPACGLEGDGPPPARRARHGARHALGRYIDSALDLGRRGAARAFRPRPRPVWLLGRWRRA